jgi:transcriptional regulator with XRE-family HTH domain
MVDLIRSRPPNRGTVLGQNIRRLREAYGWTVEELAARAGVSPNWLDGVERGAAAPSLMAASAVAKALGVPLGELFGDRPPDRDPPSPGAPACRAPAQFAVPFRPLDRGLESASWHQAKRSRERKPAAMRGAN